jgi:hypothetical protein
MQGPFGRMFMNCVGRAHRVLKPDDDDDADFLQMQHSSTVFRMVFFIFKAKKSNYKVLNTISNVI